MDFEAIGYRQFCLPRAGNNRPKIRWQWNRHTQDVTLTWPTCLSYVEGLTGLDEVLRGTLNVYGQDGRIGTGRSKPQDYPGPCPLSRLLEHAATLLGEDTRRIGRGVVLGVGAHLWVRQVAWISGYGQLPYFDNTLEITFTEVNAGVVLALLRATGTPDVQNQAAAALAELGLASAV